MAELSGGNCLVLWVSSRQWHHDEDAAICMPQPCYQFRTAHAYGDRRLVVSEASNRRGVPVKGMDRTFGSLTTSTS